MSLTRRLRPPAVLRSLRDGIGSGGRAAAPLVSPPRGPVARPPIDPVEQDLRLDRGPIDPIGERGERCVQQHGVLHWGEWELDDDRAGLALAAEAGLTYQLAEG